MNTLPPSPFGAGTRYDSSGKHIESPEVESGSSVDPRIARAVGGIAAKVTIEQAQPRIWRGEEGVSVVYPHEALTPESSQRVAHSEGYAGAVSRQVDLDRAEVENILRAAADAGMTVDQWKAARRRK